MLTTTRSSRLLFALEERLMTENNEPSPPYVPLHRSVATSFHAKNQLLSKHRNDRRLIRQTTKTLRLQQKHQLKQEKIRAKYAKKLDKWQQKHQSGEHSGLFAHLGPLAHRAVNSQAAYALRQSIHQKLLR